MKTLILTALTVALVPAWGQKLDLNLDTIAAKARAKTEVDLEGPVLAAALKNVSDKNPDGILQKVTGVFVRNYEFEKNGAYTDADLRALRQQAAGRGWSRVVHIKEDNETTEIFMFTDAGQPAGFLMISAEAKELTVVHVQGTIQLAQLQEVVQSSIQFDLKNLQGHAPSAQ